MTERPDSIITLRLNKDTWGIVNDRTYRRINFVHRKKTWQAHFERDCDNSTRRRLDKGRWDIVDGHGWSRVHKCT